MNESTNIINELSAKVLLIGNTEVGKSSILSRFIDDYFSFHRNKTIGVDYQSKRIQIDNKLIKLQIWDTAGQERYRSITQTFYKNAFGVFIVFDLSDKKSFDDVKNWLYHIKSNIDYDICKVLVGNKCDITGPLRQVSQEDIDAFLIQYPLKYFECSAKDGINIKEAFLDITKDILEKFKTEVYQFGSQAGNGSSENKSRGSRLTVNSKSLLNKLQDKDKSKDSSCQC